jgi:hypothetical protein
VAVRVRGEWRDRGHCDHRWVISTELGNSGPLMASSSQYSEGRKGQPLHLSSFLSAGCGTRTDRPERRIWISRNRRSDRRSRNREPTQITARRGGN